MTIKQVTFDAKDVELYGRFGGPLVQAKLYYEDGSVFILQPEAIEKLVNENEGMKERLAKIDELLK